MFEPDLQEYLAGQANRHHHYSVGHDAGRAAAGLAVAPATGMKA